MKKKDKALEALYEESLTVVVRSGTKFPVDFDLVWRWVEYSSKQKALDMLLANFEEGTDYIVPKHLRNQKKGENQTEDCVIATESVNSLKPSKIDLSSKFQDVRAVDYWLSVDCFKAFCLMAGTEKGKLVRKYYIELEKRYFKGDLGKRSTENRNRLTAEWKRQGCSGWHYPALTKEEYLVLEGDRNLVKADMNRDQIARLSIFEESEAYVLSQVDEGTLRYKGCKQSIHDTASALSLALETRVKQLHAKTRGE